MSDKHIICLMLIQYVMGPTTQVVGSSAVDPGSNPGNVQLRQESGVGQEIANFSDFLKLDFSIQF